VRLRIACRDVTKVRKTAKGTLGLYIIDFGFEREVLLEVVIEPLRVVSKLLMMLNLLPRNQKLI
jgi:hypothetical protein